MEQFEIIDFDKNRIDELIRLYQSEWWTKDRSRADVLLMLLNTTLNIGIIDREKQLLVGFVRVLSDRVFKAFVFDVIVKPDYRGEGLGRMLMEAVFNHPQLEKVRHFELYCLEEMRPFYQQFGFQFVGKEMKLMRKQRL